MDSFIQELMASGPLGIVASALVYLIIHIQRRNSTESRDKEISKLTSDIAELSKEKELMQKDISYLMSENTSIKEDLKEIKNTLNTMALALERIAAKYDEK
jgi:septal ring factor EnvC (AmiA/AmiB activator)